MAHFLNYTVVGATLSHADHTILLVQKGIDAERISWMSSSSDIATVAVAAGHGTTTKLQHDNKNDNDDEDDRHLPAVMAKLTFQSRTLLVASVHLAPFNRGESKRQRQIERLMNIAATTIGQEGGGETSAGVPVILAGDMNMRPSEDEVMEQTFHMVDFWRLAGSDPAMKFTMDSINHGHSFNQYHGDLTREYNARYDRVYYYYHDSSCQSSASSPPAAAAATATAHQGTNEEDDSMTNDLNRKNRRSILRAVSSFELIANKPVTNKCHFLSDHFGIATTFELDWPDA